MAAIHDLNLARPTLPPALRVGQGDRGEARPKEAPSTPAFLRGSVRWRRGVLTGQDGSCGCSFTRPDIIVAPRLPRGGQLSPASREARRGCRPHIDGTAGEKAVPGDQMAHDGIVLVSVRSAGHAIS